MKTIKISFQGVVDCIWVAFAVIIGGAVTLMMAALVWQEANSSWWWKAPALLGVLIALLTVASIFGWIYEKNPTIKIGGPKKFKLPEAKAINR